jgi:hypothetical protein
MEDIVRSSQRREVFPGARSATLSTPECSPLLSPSRAWRILRQRTGGRLARSTFYRWLDSGRAYSLRIGTRIYVPWQELDEMIQKCLNGEPL